ncbi:unnamed protein product [Scytosiphon promiscuus]
MYTRESDRIGTGVPPSDSKLGAIAGRRQSLGERAREKRQGKHPVTYVSDASIERPPLASFFGV